MGRSPDVPAPRRLLADFPGLAAGALLVSAALEEDRAAEAFGRHLEAARERLAAGPEGQSPEIQAWRRAFTALGDKATQHRCAARVSVLTREAPRFTI